MVSKRRYIELLPEHNQTDVLKKFFGSTVDQVLQPGSSENLSGYIGTRPSYNDPTKDFYIQEPDETRTAYQLEPMMVSKDSTGAVTNLLSYSDLINYLGNENAITTDPNRLFGDDFYGWAPPIDLDKIQNFRQYYWFGDEPTVLPILTLTAAHLEYQGDGSTNRFAMPPAVAGVDVNRENPIMFVNNVVFGGTKNDDGTLSASAVPPAGAAIRVYRYADLTPVVEDHNVFDPRPWVIPAWTAGMQYRSGDVISYPDYNTLYVCQSPHTAGASFDATLWQKPDTAIPCPAALTNGMRLRLNDAVAYYQGNKAPAAACILNPPPVISAPSYPKPWNDDTRPDTFFIEGVGQFATTLVECPVAMNFKSTAAIYTTINRRSRDRNPWSFNNFWVHEAAFRWAGVSFATKRATRAIVEFIANVELAYYGTNRIMDIQATLTGDPEYIPTLLDKDVDYFRNISDWDIWPYDTLPYESSAFETISLLDANAEPVQQLFVDDRKALNYGDRVLVLQNDIPDLNGAILTVVKGSRTVTAADGTQTEIDVMILVPEPRANSGDVTRLLPGRWIPWDKTPGTEPWFLAHDGLDNSVPYEFMNEPMEYYYDGISWHEAQARHPDSPDPRFALYTADLVRHDLLPQNDYTGNRLFGYDVVAATDDGAVYDQTLGRYINYGSGGEIQFRNDQVTQRTTSAGVEVPGYQFFRVYGVEEMGDAYHNAWYPTGERSHQVLTGNTFSLPTNLTNNPNNEEVTKISRSEDLEHFTNIMLRQPGFTGSPYNINNYRDTVQNFATGYPADSKWTAGAVYKVGDRVSYLGVIYDCSTAGTAGLTFDPTMFTQRPTHRIVQNRSPLLRTMLLASDDRFDYLDAVRFVDNEYLRFRQKFVQYVTQMNTTGVLSETDDADLWVETALKYVCQAKTNDFPFSLSSMAGGQYFIPPTAAHLGILNAWAPTYETDDTYSPPALFLRGHDGSRTAIEGTFVDSILLALEKRIYNAILSTFKGEADRPFSFATYESGKWRGDNASISEISQCNPLPPPVDSGVTTYSLSEMVHLYTPIFLRYAQLNRLDWRTNNTYIATDPFTWNYHGLTDRDGIAMPGHFRAIYRFYFDTDRPHAEPWVMLGFGQKPTWWDAEYGPAPYTSGNTHLWSDLRFGIIRQGVRAGVDARYTRVGLINHLPVDEGGRLLNPMQIGIFAAPPSPEQASADWMVGDGGPGETIWRNSVDYPFARCQIGYLMRPAEWVECNWDSYYFRVFQDGQVYNGGTQDRLTAAENIIHGETVNSTTGERVQLLGIQQWVSDFVVSRYQKPEVLGRAVRGMNVQLAHKMAGYTKADTLSVYADNSGILPQQDVEVVLHTSAPYREAVYSGVIVEWTGAGYSVVGYDTTSAGFCLLNGDPNGPQQTLSLGVNPAIYEWHPSVYYTLGLMVDYQGSTFRCTTAHTSGTTFDREYWTAEPQNGKKYPTVTVFVNTDGTRTFVPYGTVFETVQDLSRFLWDYGRALTEAGFVFDYINPKTGTAEDWTDMILRFLNWAQMDWQPGNFVGLSPGASQFTYTTDHGYVLSLDAVANGIYGLLDRTGRPIPSSQTFVSRLDEETKILGLQNNIFCARLRVVESEHVLLFSNKTIFGDLIYDPLLSLSQPRLRVFGLRVNGWSGRIDAPGYMVEGNTIEPNFWRAAQNLRQMFEVEGSEDIVLRDYSRHLIGYQSRDYLNNLLISQTEQFEFYQGMIKQKGAPSVFNRLTRSKIVDNQVDLTFLDEWGFQTGIFGATDKRRRVSFMLSRSDVRGNPQLVQFGSYRLSDTTVSLPAGDSRWIQTPLDVEHVFWPVVPDAPFAGITSPAMLSYPRKYRTAGPVRTTEATYSATTPDNLPTLFSLLQAQAIEFMGGDRIWIYDDNTPSLRYDVLRVDRVTQSGSTAVNPIIAVEAGGDDSFLGAGTIRIVFSYPHSLTPDDLGNNLLISRPIYNAQQDYSGFHQITSIETPTTVLVQYPSSDPTLTGVDLSQIYAFNDLQSAYITRSVHFPTTATRDAFQKLHGFGAGELAYIDSAFGYTGWVVTLWTGTEWVEYRQQPRKVDSNRLENIRIYGMTTQVGSDLSLNPDPSYLDHMTVIDPVLGNISGVADRELTYKGDTDPAQYQARYYNANTAVLSNPAAWGPEHVSELWWDTSKTYFLETETDITATGNGIRDGREMTYRSRNWGKIAPGCGVDIWEWTRSLDAPYASDIPNQSVFGDVNQVTEYDTDLQTMVTAYYYWNRNPTTIPNLPGRQCSAAQVAALIRDPLGEDVSWIAPIAPNAMLIANVEEFLNDTDTVVQFDLTDDNYDGLIHHEYALVREGDPNSLPPDFLFALLRNSLTGFDDFVQGVGDPTLPAWDAVGATIRDRRSMVDGGRSGLLAARESFVVKMNQILMASPLLVDQPNALSQLTLATPTYKQLIWDQPQGEDWIEAPPRGSYDFVVQGLDERKAILGSNEVLAALGFNGFGVAPYDTVGWDYDFATTYHDLANKRAPRVLMTNYNGDRPGWSIWELKLRSENQPLGYEVPPIPKPLPQEIGSITPTPTPPIAVDDVYVGQPDAEQKISVNIFQGDIIQNDYDPQGRQIHVMSVGPLPVGEPGTLTMLRAGAWLYEAPAGTFGEVLIPYTIIDTKGLKASAVIHINMPKPVLIQAVDDFFSTREDQPLTFTVDQILANDLGTDLTVKSLGTPALGGKASMSGRTITFTPAAQPSTSDNFTYSVQDANGNVSMATIHIAFTPAPVVANDDQLSFDVCVPTPVTATDDQLTFDVCELPAISIQDDAFTFNVCVSAGTI